jgi:hypothetical protein
MKKEKILLMMLPYWDPLIPPQGIAHLKRFLRHHGYETVACDANIDEGFKDIYNRYFAVLRRHVPLERQGNFFNIGHDVLRNHMTAHIHAVDRRRYLDLLRIIVHRTFYTFLEIEALNSLVQLLGEFYRLLERYVDRRLEELDPGVLGISVPRDCLGPSLFAFRHAKTKRPSIRTFMGGSVFSDHLLAGTPNFETFLDKTPYIDHIVIGEGQLPMLKLLQGELDRSTRVVTRGDIGGEMLGFSPLNGPDMSDFQLPEDYPYLAGQASASCPFGCSFCNVQAFFGPYREKTADRTVEEMTALYRQYGLQMFFMNDAMLNHVAGGLADAFLKSDIPLYWDGYLRVSEEVADVDTTLHWRKGGFYRARLGVESGSQHVLDLMDKQISVQQTGDSICSLAAAGIKTTAYWVIGHPGETEADFKETLRLLGELKDDIYEAECNPFIYGYGGQAHSDKWEGKRALLYPAEANDMLLIDAWTLETEPSREEAYRRVNRFAARCRELGIPNPYSLHDIFQADKRWQRLHRNAVPPLVEFKSGVLLDECRRVKAMTAMTAAPEDDGDFGF